MVILSCVEASAMRQPLKKKKESEAFLFDFDSEMAMWYLWYMLCPKLKKYIIYICTHKHIYIWQLDIFEVIGIKCRPLLNEI